MKKRRAVRAQRLPTLVGMWVLVLADLLALLGQRQRLHAGRVDGLLLIRGFARAVAGRGFIICRRLSYGKEAAVGWLVVSQIVAWSLSVDIVRSR